MRLLASALLLFALAWMLASTEARARRIAADMTQSFRRSEQRFRNAMQYSAIGKALLSRLELSDQELDKYTEQLDAILEYIDVLNQVDTSGVEPMAHVLDLRNVMRPDVVQPSLPREAALQNAPEPDNGFFKVPKIVE